jgi:hypothetical protein
MNRYTRSEFPCLSTRSVLIESYPLNLSLESDYRASTSFRPTRRNPSEIYVVAGVTEPVEPVRRRERKIAVIGAFDPRTIAVA